MASDAVEAFHDIMGLISVTKYLIGQPEGEGACSAVGPLMRVGWEKLQRNNIRNRLILLENIPVVQRSRKRKEQEKEKNGGDDDDEKKKEKQEAEKEKMKEEKEKEKKEKKEEEQQAGECICIHAS